MPSTHSDKPTTYDYWCPCIGFLEQSLVNNLLEECAKMAEFDHPNVLSLIGVCLDGGPAPFIVMPFMHNGSLIYHLKREREKLVVPPQKQLDSASVSFIAEWHI